MRPTILATTLIVTNSLETIPFILLGVTVSGSKIICLLIIRMYGRNGVCLVKRHLR